MMRHDFDDPILSKQDVAAWLGVHITTIDRWSAAGEFVPKIRLGPARVGVRRSLVEQWLVQREVSAA